MEEIFTEILYFITRAMEAAGILIIVLGAIIAAAGFVKRRNQANAYGHLRATFGRAILLGLELLVAADIIGTVAIEPSLQSLAILASIILIRTFLSFSLEVEIEGRWPWQRDRKRDVEPS